MTRWARGGPAGTDEVGAMRSPDAGNRDYWDDEQRGPETAPDGGRIVTDPSMTGQGGYGTTAPTGTGGIAPAAGYGSQAGTAAGYGSQASTEAGASSSPGTTPGYGSRAGPPPATAPRPALASGYGTQGGIATDPQGAGSSPRPPRPAPPTAPPRPPPLTAPLRSAPLRVPRQEGMQRASRMQGSVRVRRPTGSVISVTSPSGTCSRMPSSTPRNGSRSSSGSWTIRKAR